jgi:glycosyltransferase involved in cell wall biosynthesis
LSETIAAYAGPDLGDADGNSVLQAARMAGEGLGRTISILPVAGDAKNRWLRYVASDVVIATTGDEKTEQRSLEAMACGRPVIGSAIDETALALGEGLSGYLVPPRASEELAERLKQLLTQPALGTRMGMAARVWIEQEYSWPAIARRTAALYDSVLPLRTLQTASTGAK